MTDTLLDRAGVKAKFDVYPEQIVGYLALIGDSIRQHSRRAQGRAQDRGQVAQRVRQRSTTSSPMPAEIAGKVGESLREHLHDAGAVAQACNHRLRLRAARSTPAELAPRAPDNERLRELYTRLELRSLLRQLGSAQRHDARRASAGGGQAATAAAPVPAAAHPRALRNYRDGGGSWSAGSNFCAGASVCLRYRNHESQLHGGADRRRFLRVEPGDAAYVPLGSRLRRRTRAARSRHRARDD